MNMDGAVRLTRHTPFHFVNPVFPNLLSTQHVVEFRVAVHTLENAAGSNSHSVLSTFFQET